jgi:hypothetical protein
LGMYIGSTVYRSTRGGNWRNVKAMLSFLTSVDIRYTWCEIGLVER